MNLILNISFVLFICLVSLENQCISGQNRIVGGQEANIEDFPYMLWLIVPRIKSDQANFCGAGIISKDWAVTAAHCFLNPNKDITKMRVIAGTADLQNRAKTSKIYKVAYYIQHELFTGKASPNAIEGDIAVIKIEPPLEFNNAIKPLKLPEQNENIETSSATIAGWGKTSSNGKSTSKLRYIKVPRVSTNKCIEHYRRHSMRVYKGEICYGFHNSTLTADKCEGDSGGPLVNDNNIVLGVVSRGVRCGEDGYPGIYTDTLFFRDWIRSKTGV